MSCAPTIPYLIDMFVDDFNLMVFFFSLPPPVDPKTVSQ